MSATLPERVSMQDSSILPPATPDSDGQNKNQPAQNQDLKTEVDANNELDESCRQRKSIQTLSEGHTKLKSKLERCRADLVDKEDRYKELEEEISCQRDKNSLIQERIQCTAEQMSRLTIRLQKNEKQDEALFKEIVDMKWRINQAQQSLDKLQAQQTNVNGIIVSHQKDVMNVENIGQDERLRDVREEIKQLKYYKSELENGNVELCAILNGNKMLELEQKKRAIIDDIAERDAHLQRLKDDIRSKTELLEGKKSSVTDTKAQYEKETSLLKSKLRYSLETEHRIERSRDYFLAKIDYGMNVPAPPPWPDYDTLLRSRKFKNSSGGRKVT